MGIINRLIDFFCRSPALSSLAVTQRGLEEVLLFVRLVNPLPGEHHVGSL